MRGAFYTKRARRATRAGPVFHRIGVDYGRSAGLFGTEYLKRATDFLRDALEITSAAKITLHVEGVRGAECVGFDPHPGVLLAMLVMAGVKIEEARTTAGILLDVHHEIDRGRDPANSIMTAGTWMSHFHAHGKDRVPAGSWVPHERFRTDPINWHQVACALDAIGYRGAVVAEPFGPGIREVAPDLGEGIPKALPPDEFFRQNWEHLHDVGIIEMAS